MPEDKRFLAAPALRSMCLHLVNAAYPARTLCGEPVAIQDLNTDSACCSSCQQLAESEAPQPPP